MRANPVVEQMVGPLLQCFYTPEGKDFTKLKVIGLLRHTHGKSLILDVPRPDNEINHHNGQFTSLNDATGKNSQLRSSLIGFLTETNEGMSYEHVLVEEPNCEQVIASCSRLQSLARTPSKLRLLWEELLGTMVPRPQLASS